MSGRGAVGPLAAIAASIPVVTFAVDIEGIQPAALDQPRINVWLLPSGASTPYTYTTEGFDWDTFEVVTVTGFHIDDAYFDTGASGILLSEGTADLLGISKSSYGGKSVVYEDVGVAGSDLFHASSTLDVVLAPYHPNVDAQINGAESDYTATHNVANLQSALAGISSQRVNGIRTQIGPIGGGNPLLGDLDVFGVPLMTGKVVVMDPKPVNVAVTSPDDLEAILAAKMRTYVYSPGTAFNPAAADSDPGIPQTNLHVKLTYASFDRFTKSYLLDESTSAISPIPNDVPLAPTLAANPFIGPNPIHAIDPGVPAGDAKPIEVTFGAHQTTGSWLLDTGAAASMISSATALSLGVHYQPGTEDTENPVLLDEFNNPLPNQFLLPVGGIGGTKVSAGFYVTSLLVPTIEGDDINLINAPVLVNDITVKDPVSGATLTLDGIFGMNNLVASANYDLSGFIPTILDMTVSAFDWVVFDQPGGTLGLAITVPEPTSLTFLGLAAVFLRRQRRGLN